MGFIYSGTTIDVVDKALTLEVGRSYVDRLGCVIEITEPWAGAIFKFTGRQVLPVFEAGPNEFRFKPDGSFMPDGRSEFDLIAEVPVGGLPGDMATPVPAEGNARPGMPVERVAL